MSKFTTDHLVESHVQNQFEKAKVEVCSLRYHEEYSYSSTIILLLVFYLFLLFKENPLPNPFFTVYSTSQNTKEHFLS